MAQPTRPVAELVDLSGGLNSAEPPDQIGPNQLSAMRNLEYRRTRGLLRRRGSVKNITGALPFAAGTSVCSLWRHTPGQSEDVMELWGISNDVTPELARLAAGTSWSAAIPLADAIASAAAAWFMRGVSFNGKLFLPYDSAVNRLHVWDAAGVVRRVGIAATIAPTVANQGAGAYAAVLRYYKVQWALTDGNGANVYSPLSAAVSFTPSGAGASVRVTRPAPPGDGETRWLVWASPDNVNYYAQASNPIATTFYDDAFPVTLYPAVSPSFAGFPTQADYFTAPVSGKFLLVDSAQLLIAGCWESTALSSSVFYTPALGTSGFGIADEERVPSTNRIDIDPQLGGGITGLGGPIGGTPLVFKLERTYLLNPTSDPTLPYTRQLLSDAVGCVSYQGIVMAEDEAGGPALYWPARRGYYRYGARGLEYCGADIEDLWATVNLSAFNGITAAYHRDAGQIWIFVPVAGGTEPTVWLKFHVARARSGVDGVRGGWTRDDGSGALCSSVCMFSDAPGAVMGLRLKPYVGRNFTGGEVYLADADTSNRDDAAATPFVAFLETRAIDKGIGEQFGVQNVYVQGVAEAAPVSLNVSLRRNFDPTDTVPAIAVTLGTQRGAVSAAGLEISECEYLQVRVTDQSALNQHWALDRVGIRVRAESPKE